MSDDHTTPEQQLLNQRFAQRVSYTRLSSQAMQGLIKNKLNYVGDIASKTPDDMQELGFDKQQRRDIELNILIPSGLQYGTKNPEWPKIREELEKAKTASDPAQKDASAEPEKIRKPTPQRDRLQELRKIREDANAAARGVAAASRGTVNKGR